MCIQLSFTYFVCFQIAAAEMIQNVTDFPRSAVGGSQERDAYGGGSEKSKF